MSNCLRGVPMVGAVIAMGLVGANADARDRTAQRPRPMPARSSLAIVGSDQGFAIQPSPNGAPCANRATGTTASAIALGSALKLDRNIFIAAAPRHAEANDAQTR